MTDSLLPFLGFALAASATPGPNNLLALATGAAWGARACVPLSLGVASGFGFMVAIIGVGLASPLTSHPEAATAIRWAGSLWLLWLAWKIAAGGAPDGARAAKPHPGLPRGGRSRPVGFWSAFVLQWVNPKGWVMAVATATTYAAGAARPALHALLLGALFALIGLHTMGAWSAMGAGTARLLTSPRRWRAFNITMGALLAASVLPELL